MTKGPQRRAILSFGIFLILVCLFSCASSKKEQIQKETGEAGRRARAELEAGEFQKAIDVYKETDRKFPNDAVVRSDYTKILESIKSSGDQAFERKNYELAGEKYELLAKNWPYFSGFSQSLSFDGSLLEGKIRSGRNLLVEAQAGSQIEAGNFQKAIDLYRDTDQKYPNDPIVRSGYVKILESIKRSGDRAFERANFALAEGIYEILGKNWSQFNELIQSLSFDRNFLEKRARTSGNLLTVKQVRLSLETGDFKRAIDVHREFFQRYPQDTTVRSAYIKTLESIKMKADRAFEKSDFALAGHIYQTLVRNISPATPLSRFLSFDRGGLTKRVEGCRKTLFEKGLERYRSGDLNRAIFLWKEILVFDPENPEVRRAVDMAVLQSKNLEKAK